MTNLTKPESALDCSLLFQQLEENIGCDFFDVHHFQRMK